jgi:hypothetical protein
MCTKSSTQHRQKRQTKRQPKVTARTAKATTTVDCVLSTSSHLIQSRLKQHHGLLAAIADTVRAYRNAQPHTAELVTPQMVVLGNQEKLIVGFVLSN